MRSAMQRQILMNVIILLPTCWICCHTRNSPIIAWTTCWKKELDFGSWQSPDISCSHFYRGTITWTPTTVIFREYTEICGVEFVWKKTPKKLSISEWSIYEVVSIKRWNKHDLSRLQKWNKAIYVFSVTWLGWIKGFHGGVSLRFSMP